jgi:NAD-dependent DNA ligase
VTYEPVYPEDLWQKQYMRQLGAQIAKWKREYYYKIASVDDATYDLWWRNLLFLEGKYPHLKDPNFPTINPGAPMEDAAVVVVERLSLDQLQAT